MRVTEPLPRHQDCSAAGWRLDSLAMIAAKDLSPALLLGTSRCSAYSHTWCSPHPEKNHHLRSPAGVCDTVCSLPVLLEGPSCLLFIRDLWTFTWQCISNGCWKVSVPLVLGIPLGRGTGGRRGRIHLLVVASRHQRGLNRGLVLRMAEQGRASGAGAGQIPAAQHRFLLDRYNMSYGLRYQIDISDSF